jgi:[protein-PII] uridylyltransferase
VWNAWKAQLLEDLYHATRARLKGTGVEVTLADSLIARQREAQRLLRFYAVPEDASASCGQSSTPSTSSAIPRTRSPGTRATCTGA